MDIVTHACNLSTWEVRQDCEKLETSWHTYIKYHISQSYIIRRVSKTNYFLMVILD